MTLEVYDLLWCLNVDSELGLEIHIIIRENKNRDTQKRELRELFGEYFEIRDILDGDDHYVRGGYRIVPSPFLKSDATDYIKTKLKEHFGDNIHQIFINAM